MLELMSVLTGPDATEVCDAIPGELENLLRLIVTFVQIGVPIILIVLGAVDLGKAVMQQEEDKIKEAQQMFVKRLIAALFVFFIIVIITFFLELVDIVLEDRSAGALDCVKSIFPTWFN